MSVFAADSVTHDFFQRARGDLSFRYEPSLFEYHIERGVEWNRIYTPGTWRPVATDTLVHAPIYASTYREWRKSYHFGVYLPEDSAGGTAADPNAMPSSCVSYHAWEYRDWETRGFQRLGFPLPAIGSAALENVEATSSLESSVPDGAWREPSPPPFYDPWNDSD